MHMSVSSTPQLLEQRYWRIWCFQVNRCGSVMLMLRVLISVIFQTELNDLFGRNWRFHYCWWTQSFWGRCWKQVRQLFCFLSWSKLKIACQFHTSQWMILSCSFFLSSDSIGKVCFAEINNKNHIMYFVFFVMSPDLNVYVAEQSSGCHWAATRT